MRVPDRNLDEVRERGWTVVEGLLDPETLRAAQDASPTFSYSRSNRQSRFRRSRKPG